MLSQKHIEFYNLAVNESVGTHCRLVKIGELIFIYSKIISLTARNSFKNATEGCCYKAFTSAYVKDEFKLGSLAADWICWRMRRSLLIFIFIFYLPSA
jgi:hypothetical protein